MLESLLIIIAQFIPQWAIKQGILSIVAFVEGWVIWRLWNQNQDLREKVGEMRQAEIDELRELLEKKRK